MFRPPYDLMSHLSWDDARQEGKDEKKWIMVNVQDMSDFLCQTLNRDHWKDENIKALLKEHFIFLQYEKNDPTGQEYIGFYFGQGYENSANYPYVAIIDPRTGEQVKLWSGDPFPQKSEFHSDIVEFLDRYSLAANSKNPVPKMKPKKKPVDVGRMTEEEMLEMALKNSLETNDESAKPSEQDPDELTQSNPDLDKGKGKATEDTAGPTPAAESPFSQISSESPHVEPEHNPASTTRIQFKHPAGRVIRRFATSDPVRRIYEWLKAEPLEGKDGVAFELKAQPGGDLIDKLDMTIEQAGLKQGTVMVEFLEDE
jgi:UBX domain-containing protein 7